MRSIAVRLNFVAILTLLATGFFGWQAGQAHFTAKRLEAQLSESLDIRSATMNLIEGRYSEATLGRLQKVRQSLEPARRRDALSDILQSYSSRDSKLLRKRIDIFLEEEVAFFKDTRRQLLAADDQLEKHGILALFSPLAGLFWLIALVRSSILKSLQRLSRRMMDFLVDRYSFQFAEPDSNELGDLQRTFNSLAQRVINTMDELKRLDQAKSEFLSIASHELRTPMTSIKGSLALLTSGVMGTLEPNPMRLIKIAEIETDRLIRLINDLLDLAKIEAGKLPLACSWLSWDETVAKSAEGLVGLAHKAGVRIEAASSPGLEVFMDRDRVQQVLTNLISNAIKFSPENSVVRVVVGRTKNGELLVNVTDQGPGISLEDQELIFHKFRQGSSPESPLVKGTGLGLAIAKALVEEHGGTIGVESTPGNGSTFWFTLPKWRDDEATSEERAA